MNDLQNVIVSGALDDLQLQHMYFLHAAAQLGNVTVWLWSDALILKTYSHAPVFPLNERLYLVNSLRYVTRVEIVGSAEEMDCQLKRQDHPAIWFTLPEDQNAKMESKCRAQGMTYKVFEPHEADARICENPELIIHPGSKRVLVTGSFDWFHSGHVRFFEECARLGDLYVIVGHDANIRLLKGEGHPMFAQQERLFMVQSVKYVTQAMISTGHGWMDAAPEIDRIRPDSYVVNEDGDVPEKRDFCIRRGIEYKVLQRAPKPGLPKRESTFLRKRKNPR